MGAKDGTWGSDDTEAKLDAIEAGIAGSCRPTRVMPSGMTYGTPGAR